MSMHPLQQKLTGVSIDTSDTIDKEYFNTHYGFPGIPVLFKNAFFDWEIRTKWTFDHLESILQEKVAPEKIWDNGMRQAMTLTDYINKSDPSLYYKTNNHLKNVLQGDYTTPACFDCWYSTTKVGRPKNRLSWLYVGVRNSFSELHRDIWYTSAWNYLIQGRKLWFIYPSTYSEMINRDKERYKISGKDINGIANDIIRPLICIQESGEMIFVPGDYYHAVINLEDSISLTENFMNETNYEKVRSYFRAGNNKKNISDIEAIIKDGFDKLKSQQNVVQ